MSDFISEVWEELNDTVYSNYLPRKLFLILGFFLFGWCLPSCFLLIPAQNQMQHADSQIEKDPSKPKTVTPILPAPRPFMDKAVHYCYQISNIERKLITCGQELDCEVGLALESINSFDFQGELLTFSYLKKMSDELLGQVEKVSTLHVKFSNSAREYERLLRSIRPKFSEAEKTFRESAKNEKYTDLKANYLQLASIAKLTNEKLVARENALGPSVRQVSESLDYILKTKEFLHRLNQFLKAIPGKEIDASEFVGRLKAYIEKFRTLQKTLEKFNEALEKSQKINPDFNEARGKKLAVKSWKSQINAIALVN